MIDPRVIRELSWAASKLSQVAAVLNGLSDRLTKANASDKMPGSKTDTGRTKAMSPGSETGSWAEPHQFRLDYDTEERRNAIP